ncbi:hypothetical protein CDAR_501581 [Caerostris darwini]|uniref:Uncharacterized protein n=1 Tax=Caerostris darwini TaxID=1538125 RepID=A0AAV4PW15_9ARAC|nr:hypothetical protein CDAR_501581 [Caerostris darwini]
MGVRPGPRQESYSHQGNDEGPITCKYQQNASDNCLAIVKKLLKFPNCLHFTLNFPGYQSKNACPLYYQSVLSSPHQNFPCNFKHFGYRRHIFTVVSRKFLACKSVFGIC